MEEPVRILFVDDEPSLLNIMERLFLFEDYEILTATSGEEGLRKFEESSPIHIVISDYRMPEMSGVEFLEEVYKKWPDTVRMILSGYADLDAVILAINRGHIYKFISKPWNNDEMKVTVATALERYFLRKRNQELTESLLQKNEELRQFNEKLEQLVADRTAELMQTQEQLVQSEKLAAIGILAAGIAHEIKNPLAIITMGMEYMKSVIGDNAMLQEVADKLKHAALRADTIVKGLLSYTRQNPLTFKESDITTLIDETLTFTEHELQCKNIEVIRKYADGLPRVQVDANQIKQVFVNLLVNGIDAMPEGGRFTIRVECSENDTGKKVVQVVYTDTGHGIPAEKIGKIFDPFFTTKDIGNTGLGLSVSKGIIDKHGGTIQVESRIDVGTSFFIRLPVA
ncbi:MAG: ATP-binding protein [Deltaproteobacteria bacterium]|nr:ATP-binding protein [Deltaproteobacteria bacterium]